MCLGWIGLQQTLLVPTGRSIALNPYFEVCDGGCVEVQTGLPLPAPGRVEPFQGQTADGQPLAGREL